MNGKMRALILEATGALSCRSSSVASRNIGNCSTVITHYHCSSLQLVWRTPPQKQTVAYVLKTI
jgi:hypothetical protein